MQTQEIVNEILSYLDVPDSVDPDTGPDLNGHLPREWLLGPLVLVQQVVQGGLDVAGQTVAGRDQLLDHLHPG